MAISGIISSEDILKLVEQSLAKNYETLQLIEARKERYNTSKSDWDEIRTAVEDLESSMLSLRESSTFYSSSVTSSDTSIVTASAGSNAARTTYDLTNIVLAQAASKVNASTLGLSSGTSAYYESTSSVAGATTIGYSSTMDSLTGWTTNADAYRHVDQESFDGEDTFSIYNTGSWIGVYSQAATNIGTNQIPDQYTLETRLYLDDVGTYAEQDFFQMEIQRGDHTLSLRFASNGLYVSNGSSYYEIGTDITSTGEWADWKFEVDASDPATATMNVYKDDILVASGVDVSRDGTFTDGNITLRQYSNYSTNQMHISSLDIYQTDTTGIVGQNLLLDGSEGATNIGASITDGTFEINGQEIDIDISEDTLMDVLSKINSSGAGVTATWDDDNDRIRLTIDEPGISTIEFGSTDTSGFLAAMYINTSSPTEAGIDPAWERELSDVAAFSGISDGYFSINNINFQVDTAVDSLQDIINEINDSAAGVSAYYSETLDKVVLTSVESGENITFGNDTSNFITAIFGDTDTAAFTQGSVDVNGQTIAIDGNTFDIGDVQFTVHETSTDGASVTVARDTETAQTAIETFVEKYNALKDLIDEKQAGNLSKDRLLNNMESQLRNYVLGSIDNTGTYDFLRDIGIVYSRGKLSLDSSDLEDAFRTSPDSVYKLFGYDTDGDDIRDDGGLSNVMKFYFFDDLTSSYSGDISARQRLIDGRIANANADITSYEKVIEDKRQRLLNQYNQFAEQVNAMNEQYSTYQSQLSMLNQLTTSLYSLNGGSSSGVSLF